jgi:predicted transcriptional regulator
MKKMRAVNHYESILSPLEADVLKILWPGRKMKVREIYTLLKTRKKVALSSVAVILDRLYEKGVVDRTMETGRGGIRYIYFPKKDKRQFEQSVIETAVNGLIEKFGPTAVSYFNERFARRARR